MKTNMNKILPVMSGNGGKMKNMMPLASNMMGMGTGMQGQNQQQSGVTFL